MPPNDGGSRNESTLKELLHQSEVRYQAVVSALTDYQYSVHISHGNAVQTIQSPACVSVTGYTADEFARDPYLWIHMVVPEHRELVRSRIQEVLDGKDIPPIEHRICRKDGEERWVVDTIIPHRDDRGKLLSYDGVIKDITDKKQHDEIMLARLRLSEQAVDHDLNDLLQTAIDEGEHLTGSSIGFFHFVESNQQRLVLQCWSSNTIRNQCKVERKGTQYDLNSAGVWAEALRQRRPVIHNDYLSLPHRNGLPPGHAEVRRELVVPVIRGNLVVALFGVGNKASNYTQIDVDTLMSMATLAWDIVQRKQAEQAKREIDAELNESRAYLQAVLDASNDAFFVHDADTLKIIDVNQRMCEMYGYTREEATRLAVGDLSKGVSPWSQKEALEWLEKARVLGPQLFEWRAKRKNGELFWVEISVRLTVLETGGRFVVTVRDIENRKTIETEAANLETQNRQLQKAESLGRMAGAIAHHFNNQLQTVMLSLEMVKNDVGKNRFASTTLSEAMMAARRAAEVSALMLTYLGQAHGKQERLHLAEQCRQALPLLQLSMPKKTELKCDFPSPGPIVSSNSNQLRQVLANLLTNAWESFPEGDGTIHLIVRTCPPGEIPVFHRFPIGWQPQNQDYACLEIADTGTGIPASDIEKVFDPFYSSKFTGRGLGLPVVLGIVRSHSGVVTVESEPGLGSVFRVFIPVVSMASAQQPAEVQKPFSTPCLPASVPQPCGTFDEKGSILLVEDEASLRKVAANALKGLGFKVIIAKDGVEALEQFQQYQNDIRIVLCDLTMPRMDGWETIEALRKVSPCIPVILSSGYDEAQVMAGNHAEKPQAFLSKPYEFDVFCETLNRVLKMSVKN